MGGVVGGVVGGVDIRRCSSFEEDNELMLALDASPDDDTALSGLPTVAGLPLALPLQIDLALLPAEGNSSSYSKRSRHPLVVATNTKRKIEITNFMAGYSFSFTVQIKRRTLNSAC